jgi:hypothetical protein
MHDQVQELQVLLFLRFYLNVFVGCRLSSRDTEKGATQTTGPAPKSNGGLLNRSINKHE